MCEYVAQWDEARRGGEGGGLLNSLKTEWMRARSGSIDAVGVGFTPVLSSPLTNARMNNGSRLEGRREAECLACDPCSSADDEATRNGYRR
jgi:hypothetical protein